MPLLDDLAPRTIVLADKAYDSNAIRDPIESQGVVPNIPSKINRRWKSCFSHTLYKGRNAVERMFCRLKDYRRHRHQIRQARHQLPRRHLPRCRRHMVVMSPDPNRHVRRWIRSV